MDMDTLRLHGSSEFAKISKFEEEGLSAIKEFIDEYLNDDLLNDDDSCSELRLYLEQVKVDDMLLVKYLRGKKNDPIAAWYTLRKYSENRFKFYPEVFPTNGIPAKVRQLVENNVVGVLKKTDKFGRRIVFIDITKWDTDLYSMEDMTMVAVLGSERFWKEPEVLEKGIVLIENTQGFNMTHVKLHTMHNLMRLRNIFLSSFPLKIKGIYYLHMPLLFSLVFKMTKPILPKKFRSRVFLYAPSQKPSELFDIASVEILPTWAGGTLPVKEAAEDISFFESYINQFSQKNIINYYY